MGIGAVFRLCVAGLSVIATAAFAPRAEAAMPAMGRVWLPVSADYPNQITELTTHLVVPPNPPPAGTLFLWPGIQSTPRSANFLPINNGVLQPVLAWGTSCAPTAQPQAYRSWWISGQYVNMSPGAPTQFRGCHSGPSMPVSSGDLLTMDIALNVANGVWTQTITDGSRTVRYTISLAGQAQSIADFLIESYGASIRTPVVFTDTKIRYQLPWSDCPVETTNAVMSPPVMGDWGTSCFISAIVLTAFG